MFNNDCTPSTAETSKTLAKLLLYYNSLNQVTLLCKVSDWCVLFNLKNQELQISNLCGHQQQQQQHPKTFSLMVSALTHNITIFLGENQWPGTMKFCLNIMWTAVPVSLNEMRRSFQLRSDPVLSDKCSSSIAHHAESNHHCPVNDS